LDGRTCLAGLDLSSKLDLTAFVLEFETERGYEVLCRFWLPKARVEDEERRGRLHYAQWVREGWIAVTEGEAIDYAFIEAEIRRLAKRYRISQIAFDGWAANSVLNNLVGDGIATMEPGGDKPVLVECGQGYKSLSSATKDVEVSVVKGRLRHNGNPVLAWMANNVALETDAVGNVKPSKAKAAGKIDGVVSLVMARSRRIVLPEEQPPESSFTVL
jgi:phage terminase large subunit-like protein